MAFNVNKIIQSVNSSGVLKPSKFEVVIGPPSLELNLRCIAAYIPGITINTTDFKLYGGMPVLKVPSSRTYSDLRLTFLTRSDSADRYFFDNWFNLISNVENNTVAYYNTWAQPITINVYDELNLRPAIESTTSNITYEGDSTGSNGSPSNTVSASVTFNENAVSYSVKVINAIPISIDEVELSWADTDRLMEYSVTFSYEQLQLPNKLIMIG